MFCYEYPIFEHKNLLKKDMLDELRDYPLSLSRMYFDDYGDGIMQGCELSWENDILTLHSGLIHYRGNIYRMEKPYRISCPATDQLTYLKIRFATMNYERGHRRGIGEVVLNGDVPENEEMEMGRFQLQEGARLRTVYENFEDYQTEYDTANRIYVPYARAGGSGLWPQLLRVFAIELLKTGTTDVHDVGFAMTVLGTDGQTAPTCIKYYLSGAGEEIKEQMSNEECYRKLLHILRIRKSGKTGWKHQDGERRQMVLL